MLQIKKFEFNPFQENTYIIHANNSCIIIDPGCYFEEEQNILMQYILDNNLQPQSILLTHCHLDHVFGVNFLLSKFDIPFIYHKAEMPIANNVAVISAQYNIPTGALPEPSSFYTENTFSLEEYKFKILETPGHSPGSVSFYNEENKMLISGDALFYLSIGRTDLPMGDHETLINSIQTKLFTLPDDVKVYCGHGAPTSIGFEKSNNPFCAL